MDQPQAGDDIIPDKDSILDADEAAMIDEDSFMDIADEASILDAEEAAIIDEDSFLDIADEDFC